MARRKLPLWYIPIAVAALVGIVQLVSLALPAGSRDQLAQLADATARPTRTVEPSATPPPATATMAATATATRTPLPPSATPEPPTPTLEPATPTLEPTETPVPPTPAPAEPTAVPPTVAPPPPTASPAGIVQQIEVDNGEWGKGFILFKFANDTEFFVEGGDGHRYRPSMGFLSNPQAIAKAQEIWTWAARGSASWRMIVELREEVGWVSCSNDDRVCWEESVHSGMASITSQVYLHRDQWAELINAYNGGGVDATTRVSHYDEIQKTVFDPIFDTVPDIPTIGFRFERID